MYYVCNYLFSYFSIQTAKVSCSETIHNSERVVEYHDNYLQVLLHTTRLWIMLNSL